MQESEQKYIFASAGSKPRRRLRFFLPLTMCVMSVALALILANVASADFSNPTNNAYDRYTQPDGQSGLSDLLYGSLGDGSDVWTGIYDESTDLISGTYQWRVPTFSGTGSNDEAKLRLSVYECGDGVAFSTSTCTAVLFNTQTVWLGGASQEDVWYDKQFDLDVLSGSSYAFIPDNDYYWILSWELHGSLSVRAFDLGGTSQSVYPITKFSPLTLGVVLEEDAILTPYMVWEGTNDGPEPAGPPSPFTRVELISPERGEITDGTTVEFELTYYNGLPPVGVGSEICIAVDDLTDQQSLVPLCDDILVDGAGTFSTSTSLTEGHFYQWRGFIRDENGALIVSSSGLYTFSVVSAPQTPVDQWGGVATTSSTTLPNMTMECDPESGLFASSICNMALFLFSPSDNSMQFFLSVYGEMQSKIPFVYVYDFVRMIGELPVVDDEPPTLTIEAWDGVEVPILSASTTDQFYPEATRTLFHTTATMMIWVLGGFALWNMRTSLFAK